MTILRYLLAIAGLVGAGILPARRSIPGPAAVPLSVMFTVAGLGFGATTALVVPVPPMLAGVAVLFVMNAIAWRHVPTWRHQVGAPGGRALAVWAFAGAGAPMIVGSLTPATMFDARVTWFLHAHWLSGSQLRLLSAIRSPAFRYLNPDYPPAIPSAIAAVWRVTTTRDPELAQFVVAVLTVCAIAFSSIILADMAADAATGPGRSPSFRFHWWVPVVFTAAAVTVVGEYGYNGGIDGFLACSFVALVLALLRPPPSMATGAVMALALSTALAKNEGLALVGVTALVLSAYGPIRQRIGRARLRALWACVAIGGSWTVLVRARGATGSYSATNVSAAVSVGTSLVTKTRIAAASISGQIIGALLIFVVAISLDRFRSFSQARRAADVPSTVDDERAQTAIVLGVVAFAGAAITLTYYLISPNPIRSFLAGSVDRVTMGPKLLFLTAAIVSVPSFTLLERRRAQGAALALLGLLVVGKAAREVRFRLRPSMIEASQPAGRTDRCVERQVVAAAPIHAKVVVSGEPRWRQRVQAMTFPRYELVSDDPLHRESGAYLLSLVNPKADCPTVNVELMP